MRALGVLATCVLALAWLALGTLKMIDAERALFLQGMIESRVAQPLALAMSVGEIALGIALMLPKSRTPGLLASAALLCTYATWSLLAPPATCNCAGRLIALSATHHALLICALLVLVALALWSQERKLRTRHLVGVAACIVLAGMIALAMTSSRPTSPSHPFEVPMVTVEPHRGPSPTLEGMPHVRPGPTNVRPPISDDQSVRGTVSSPDGAVPGASVWLALGSDALAPSQPRTQTDQEGKFILSVGDGSHDLFICASARGLLPFCESLSTVPKVDDALMVTLSRAGAFAVSVRVVDDEGKPIPAAAVEAWGQLAEDHLREESFGPLAVPRVIRSIADDMGQSTLFLDERSYRIVAMSAGYSQLAAHRAPVIVPTANTPPVEVTLYRPYYFRVIACDARTGEDIMSAAYQVQLAGAWGPGGGVFPKSRSTRGHLLYEGGAVQGFVRKALEPLPPIPVTVSAPGYIDARVSLKPLPLAEDQVYRVPLSRVDALDTGTVTLFARWSENQPLPEGQLIVSIKDRGGRVYGLPAFFVDGKCDTPLPLPDGQYEAALGPGEGSTTFWTRPTRRPWQAFEVTAHTNVDLEFRLAGGRLVLRPRTAGRIEVPEFKFVVDGVARTTWLSVAEYAREGGLLDETGGVILYLNAGSVKIGVRKHGFINVDSEQRIGNAGELLLWEPVLDAE